MRKKDYENIVEKGENTGYQHFLLFPQGFSTFSQIHIVNIVVVDLLSVNLFNFDMSKILSFGKKGI